MAERNTSCSESESEYHFSDPDNMKNDSHMTFYDFKYDIFERIPALKERLENNKFLVGVTINPGAVYAECAERAERAPPTKKRKKTMLPQQDKHADGGN